ncbi:MAG: hypothetical protein ACYC4D_03915 [Thermoleophilia bacterium]
MKAFAFRNAIMLFRLFKSKRYMQLIILVILSSSLTAAYALASDYAGGSGYGGAGSDGYCKPGVRANGYNGHSVGQDGYCNSGVGNNEGRMTGGGKIVADKTGVRADGYEAVATHGFELHCDAGNSPNNLEVNWGRGNRFHLDEVQNATCSRAKGGPGISPWPPVAGFNVHSGIGSGSLNGEAGATIEWWFADFGEPGKDDYANIVIKDADGNLALVISGKLQNGNHQAHDGIGVVTGK